VAAWKSGIWRINASAGVMEKKKSVRQDAEHSRQDASAPLVPAGPGGGFSRIQALWNLILANMTI
jgi:hypothetical protein